MDRLDIPTRVTITLRALGDVRAMELNETRRIYGGLRGLLDALWRIHTRDEFAILGVVVATDGSTYQKPGTLVLLDAHGLRHGVISGGCLEPALEHAARDVYSTRRAATVDFDTRSDEDLLFGSGIGCRGRVQLLLLPLPPQAPLARALFDALDRGVTLELSLAITGENTGAGVAIFAAEPAMTHSAIRWDATGRTSAADISAPTANVHIAPPPRLLLLGAGPETPPFAAFARRLGWFVNVVEHRGRWSGFAQEAQIDRHFDLAPEVATVSLLKERVDAIVVMSHNFAIDLAYLRFCASSGAAYVGLLGPRARCDALLAELSSTDVERLKPRLHAPVGLDLGGQGPEAIALAIASELQQRFSGHASAIANRAMISEHA